MSDKEKTLIIKGTPLSPGLAQGSIHIHHALLGPIDAPEDIEQHDVDLLGIAPGTPVPATPGWTVHDVVAHLTGLAGDWVHGNLDGYASPEWTQGHVDERVGRTPGSLAAEWAHHADGLTAILRDPLGSGLPDPLIAAFGPVPAIGWPDVIVTDIRMPGLDGIELSYRIRQQSPSTIIALMTGEGSDVGTDLMNDGAVDYFFLKPFDNKKVCEIFRAELKAA